MVFCDLTKCYRDLGLLRKNRTHCAALYIITFHLYANQMSVILAMSIFLSSRQYVDKSMFQCSNPPRKGLFHRNKYWVARGGQLPAFAAIFSSFLSHVLPSSLYPHPGCLAPPQQSARTWLCSNGAIAHSGGITTTITTPPRRGLVDVVPAMTPKQEPLSM